MALVRVGLELLAKLKYNFVVLFPEGFSSHDDVYLREVWL